MGLIPLTLPRHRFWVPGWDPLAEDMGSECA